MPEPDAQYLHIPVIDGELRFDLARTIRLYPPRYALTEEGERALAEAERLADPEQDARIEAGLRTFQENVRAAVERRQAEEQRRTKDARLRLQARNSDRLRPAHAGEDRPLHPVPERPRST